MNRLLIGADAERKMLRIAANDGIWAQREVARVFVYLEDLELKIATAPAFWNIRDSASGQLESRVALKNGIPLWRLCPTHLHCIALLAEQDGDLLVLGVCSSAEIETTERRLIDR